MMQYANATLKAQTALQSKYPPAEYDRIIAEIKEKSGDDLEVLAYIANDKTISPHVRLFAVAAMGA